MQEVKQLEDKQLVQWCVQCTSRCPSRLSTKPPTIHYRLESIVSRILNWLRMGMFVCWRPSNGWMNYSTNWIYGKNIWKPKALEWTEKTKIMICSKNLHSLKDSGNILVIVFRKGVGSNSISCDGCQSWIHKKCSGFKGRLKADPNYRCKKCMELCNFGRYTAWCSRVISLSWWRNLSCRWLWTSHNYENQCSMEEVS